MGVGRVSSRPGPGWSGCGGHGRQSFRGLQSLPYLATLAELATTTRVRRLAGIPSFHTWLRDEGTVATVPQVPATARPRARGRVDTRLLGLDAPAAALLGVADEHSPRMAALIATLLTTGARIAVARRAGFDRAGHAQ